MKKLILLVLLAVLCSVAYSQTFDIFILTRQKTISDAEKGILPNGCSSKELFNRYFVRDETWRYACDQAVLDYGTSGMSKSDADARLRTNMTTRGAPEWVTNVYFNALQNSSGQAAYNSAQANAKKQPESKEEPSAPGTRGAREREDREPHQPGTRGTREIPQSGVKRR